VIQSTDGIAETQIRMDCLTFDVSLQACKRFIEERGCRAYAKSQDVVAGEVTVVVVARRRV